MFPPLQSRMYTLSTQCNKLDDGNKPTLLISIIGKTALAGHTVTADGF